MGKKQSRHYDVPEKGVNIETDFRDWSLITGREGGGYNMRERGGGKSSFTPTKKGTGKVLATQKLGGTTIFEVIIMHGTKVV